MNIERYLNAGMGVPNVSNIYFSNVMPRPFFREFLGYDLIENAQKDKRQYIGETLIFR
jgi:hypothetical protein